MKNIRVYKNADNVNFVVLCSLNHEKTEFAVLNILDETFEENGLIQLPSIQKWTLKSFNKPHLQGQIMFQSFSSLFWSAYHRTMQANADNQHMQTVLDCAYMAFDIYSTAQDQSPLSAN